MNSREQNIANKAKVQFAKNILFILIIATAIVTVPYGIGRGETEQVQHFLSTNPETSYDVLVWCAGVLEMVFVMFVVLMIALVVLLFIKLYSWAWDNAWEKARRKK